MLVFVCIVEIKHDRVSLFSFYSSKYLIACIFYFAQSRVSTIDLFENLLTGAFPPEVSLLSLDGPYSTGGGNLYRVDFFRNEFLYNNADNSWMSDLGSNMSKSTSTHFAYIILNYFLVCISSIHH